MTRASESGCGARKSAPFEWGVQLLRPVSVAQAQDLHRMGLDRVGVHLPWRWIEERPGQRETRALDWFLRPLREAGLPLLGLLGPAVPHLMPEHVLQAGGTDAPGFVDRFATSCVTALDAAPDVTAARVEGELNGARWERWTTRRRRGAAWASPAFATTLLREATGAVRAARPEVRIQVTVHASIPGWRRVLERWLNAGVTMDRLGLVLQPAFLLADPEMARRVGEAVAQARAIVGDVPVEIAKIGFPTGSPRATPRAQREFLGIAAEEAHAAGAAGLMWWALRDQAHDDPALGYWTPAQERAYGLLYYDGTTKPAADELRVLATGDRFAAGAPR